jgi:hypothetical protein
MLDQPKPKYNLQLPKEIDMSIIQRRIEELNMVMEKDGGNQIVNENGVNKFKVKKNIYYII